MNLNPKLTSLAKIGFKYIEFVENAQNEESAIYSKENKFGEDVPIKKKTKTSMTSLHWRRRGGRGRGGHFQKWGAQVGDL